MIFRIVTHLFYSLLGQACTLRAIHQIKVKDLEKLNQVRLWLEDLEDSEPASHQEVAAKMLVVNNNLQNSRLFSNIKKNKTKTQVRK